MKGQGKKASLLESVMNVFVGYAVAVVAQTFVFPLFGVYISFSENLAIAGVFTIISVIRSYTLRRLFNQASIGSVKGMCVSELHLNPATQLPPTHTPLWIEFNGGLVKVERTMHVSDRSHDMEYVTEDGLHISGKYRWTYQ